ncbi:hypothetical protein TPE_0868 [Treponema pedis str. T A4]|uniref:Uncharacterized protein n=1 Tax=Treponema pedis str. T A4 TaxID=1291379 RepID=S6A880_9SPIR|nr:hypothetical protein TPE_0868 [Treponema pedis str. T A4]
MQCPLIGTPVYRQPPIPNLLVPIGQLFPHSYPDSFYSSFSFFHLLQYRFCYFFSMPLCHLV